MTSHSDISDAQPSHLGSDHSADNKFITGTRLWVVSAALSVPVFLSTLDATIVATAVPQITSEFHSTLDIGWYSTAYTIANCAMLPMAGTLNTIFNPKIIFITFLIIFELGSALSGAAVSSNMLIIGRAFAGMGAAGLYNGALIMMAGVVKPSARAMQIGIGTAISASGTVFGPIIGGAVTTGASWRWCFYLNLPPGVLTVLIILFITFPTETSKDRPNTLSQLIKALDLIGFGLFTPTCIMLLLALAWGGTTYSWNSPTIIGLFCGSVACLGVFLLWEKLSGDKAMIPLSLLKRPIVSFSAVTVLFQFSSLVCLTYYLPIWFQTVKEASALLSGVMLLPTIISQTLFTGVAGAIVSKTGFGTPPALLGCALTTIGAGLLTTFNVSTNTGKWIGYQILLGAGRGLSLQIPLIVTQAVLPPSMIPKGTALILFSQFFGCSVFIASSQTVFANQLQKLISQYAPSLPNVDEVVKAGGLPEIIRKLGLELYLPQITHAYNDALITTWYLSIALAGFSFFTAFGMGWRHIDGRDKPASGVEGQEMAHNTSSPRNEDTNRPRKKAFKTET
ncbi:hypothetical protein FQN49_002118 [Arthroderma sp. PD_2]|nr:hypothetical protein FQN49_002118 [Arthroderma sp. PD_2]